MPGSDGGYTGRTVAGRTTLSSRLATRKDQSCQITGQRGRRAIAQGPTRLSEKDLGLSSHWQTQGEESHRIMRKPARRRRAVRLCTAVQL